MREPTVHTVPSNRHTTSVRQPYTIRQLKSFIHGGMQGLTDLRARRTSPTEMCWDVATAADWLIYYTNLLRERAQMPKTQKTESVWKGFVNLTLTSEDKEAFAAWDVQDDDVWLLLTDTIGAGHKMTLTFDRTNDHFVASFTGGGDHKTNAGYTLSAFGKDWYGAIRVLLFKHHAMLDGDYSRKLDRPTDNIG